MQKESRSEAIANLALAAKAYPPALLRPLPQRRPKAKVSIVSKIAKVFNRG